MADLRFEMGMYGLPEGARLARLPQNSLRNWVLGYTYARKSDRGLAEPIVLPPNGRVRPVALSFVNLVEILTLASFRSAGVSMQRVRKAVAYANATLDMRHLLASKRLLSDGVDVFWEFQEREDPTLHLVNMSRGGQRVFPEAVHRYLREVEWSDDSFASRWWPQADEGSRGLVLVDPKRAFGAPVIVDTGIRTEDVNARFVAGESVAQLAEDFGVEPMKIEAAIRLESSLVERTAA